MGTVRPNEYSSVRLFVNSPRSRALAFGVSRFARRILGKVFGRDHKSLTPRWTHLRPPVRRRPSITLYIQPIIISHEGGFFVPKRKFNSADHPLVSSSFEGHLHSQCASSDILTPASLARSPWLSSGRSLNLVPPYCRMGRTLNTRVAFPNVSFWGYSRTRHVLQPSKGRCLSLREIPISNELGQRPTEAQSLLFTRRVCDCIHSLWFNLV